MEIPICSISHVTLSSWWPLLTRLCCCGDISYVLCSWNLPEISSQREQPLNTRKGQWPTLPPSVFSSLQGAQPPTVFLVGFLAPMTSGLCHICLCCWPSEPLGRRRLLCPALQNLMLHQTSKDYSDMLTGDPWWNEKSAVGGHLPWKCRVWNGGSRVPESEAATGKMASCSWFSEWSHRRPEY